MSRSLAYLAVVAALVIFVGFPSAVKAVGNASEDKDTCYEERKGLLPCSSSITGNLLLMIFYGAVLGFSAKLISDGAELLLDLGVSAALVGGLILPLLGAVPDSAIIVVSGLGPVADAQRKLSVGMGTLAGSTVMLLTIAWAGSLVLGRCDLNRSGEAIEQTGEGFKPRKQGVTLLPEYRSGIYLMLITSLLYFIVQGADWYFGATNFGPQPSYVGKSALATMILCFLALIGNIVFLMYDSKVAERRAQLHKKELMARRVLHSFLVSANRQMFKAKPKGDDEDDAADGEDKPDSADVGKKYFKAWHVRKGLRAAQEKSGASEDTPLVDQDIEKESASSKSDDEEEEESKLRIAVKSIVMLVVGVGAVTIFSDPMCDVLDALTNERNKPRYIPINSFYVSFIVTPFCSNASELISSLIFASKKRQDNITLTYSQLFGASTMNNTMCLGIFMALVYFRGLRWYYSAEVLSIVLVQWVIGFVSLRSNTFKLWLAFPVAFVYAISLFFVYGLETWANWK